MALYGRFSKEPRKFSIKPVEKKMILAVALIALQFKDCSFTEIESFFNIVAESKTRKKENEHARRIAKMIPFNETTVENLKLSLLQKLNEFVQKTLLLDNINFVDCVVTRDDIGGCQAKVVCPKCGKLISVTLHKEKNAEKVRFLFGFVKRHQQYCRVITTAPHKRSANTKKSIKQRNELSATTTATDTLIADTAKPPETIPVLDNMVIVDDRSMSSEDLHTEDSSDSQENGETDSEANSGVMSEEGCEVQENDSAEDVPNPIMAPENPVLQPQQEFQQQYLNLLKQQNEAIQALIQDNKRYQAWHQRNCEQQVKNQEKLLEALQELAKKSKK
ncbi:uncharacterized protein LOC132259468 isoform X1 [Phlebotomus argentipes]|uniref:uncharacterized protein LOC132259468 isoform X1 n=1 Tax=Phlebotomus argentipes TaxID=94469 RepID=UPI0028933BA5|nr:uncharacterized protein LOC132259468 isoform X1 [Phlebotomus argentipes]